MAAVQFQYNAFGLVWQDILRAYPKSIETDFASSVDCGSRTIQSEIAMQEGILLSHLNTATLRQIEKLDWHSVDIADISGSSGFYFDFIPDTDQDIKVYIYEDVDVSTCGNKIDTRCGNFQIDDDSSLLANVTAGYDSTLDKWYGILDEVVDTEDKIYLSYTIDPDTMVLPTLKGVLRDMVACVMGSYLFTSQNDEWKLVTQYCANSERMLSMMAGKKWIPGELNKLRWVNNPFPSSIMSAQILRG